MIKRANKVRELESKKDLAKARQRNTGVFIGRLRLCVPKR